MTNMQRWLESEQAPPGVAELLAAARPPRPLDAAVRARSRRRLVAMTALPAAASVVFWIKSVALGAVLGSVVTAAVVVPKWHAAAVPSAATPAIRTNKSKRAVQRAPQPAPVIEAAPEASTAASATPAVTAAPNIGNSNRLLPVVPQEPADDRLGREIQLLERARRLLSVDPNRAMATLEEHRVEFGSGTLVLERQFLEVEALLRLGRRDQAIARAADLRARAPGSLYERRLTQLLGNE